MLRSVCCGATILLMEVTEANELRENQERAKENSEMRPVALLMAILAVLVAVTTLLGHRAATEAVLAQARASDNWNEYQAKKIRQNDTALTVDMLSTLAVSDKDAAAKLKSKYLQHSAQWDNDLKEGSARAREQEAEGRLSERREDRFDLGEALLEIGLVITSITLLTNKRAYALLGIVCGILGVLSGISAFLLHS
jgi:hypothetical protein